MIEPAIAEQAAATTLPGLLKMAMNEVPGEFAGKQPPLVSREAVAATMQAEIVRRNPFSETTGSLSRHLARLSWPMTRLFSEEGYWIEQANHYCAARWPEDHEDSFGERAVWLCSVYGEPII